MMALRSTLIAICESFLRADRKIFNNILPFSDLANWNGAKISLAKWFYMWLTSTIRIQIRTDRAPAERIRKAKRNRESNVIGWNLDIRSYSISKLLALLITSPPAGFAVKTFSWILQRVSSFEIKSESSFLRNQQRVAFIQLTFCKFFYCRSGDSEPIRGQSWISFHELHSDEWPNDNLPRLLCIGPCLWIFRLSKKNWQTIAILFPSIRLFWRDPEKQFLLLLIWSIISRSASTNKGPLSRLVHPSVSIISRSKHKT